MSEKLSREEIKQLVIKIRNGEGDDSEVSKWIEDILNSVPNREVIEVIMSGSNATVDEIVDKLYVSNAILL